MVRRLVPRLPYSPAQPSQCLFPISELEKWPKQTHILRTSTKLELDKGEYIDLPSYIQHIIFRSEKYIEKNPQTLVPKDKNRYIKKFNKSFRFLQIGCEICCNRQFRSFWDIDDYGHPNKKGSLYHSELRQLRHPIRDLSRQK